MGEPEKRRVHKVYDSLHRESVCNITAGFGLAAKLIALTKVRMRDTKYQIRVDENISEEFQLSIDLKRGDALSTFAI